MPYDIRQTDQCPATRPWGVFRRGDNQPLGCHPTRQRAERQRRALYQHESEGGMAGRHMNVANFKIRTLDRLAAFRPELATALADVRLPWFSISNQDPLVDPESDPGAETNNTEDTTHVFIYDEIGGSFGVDVADFVEKLQAITTSNIVVRLNSPGGIATDSIAVYNALVQHPSHIITRVDGVAASGASIAAMAGDVVEMMTGSQMMIHDASAMERGNPRDMEGMATFLHRQSDNIATIYAEKAGGDPADWRARMSAETWYMSSEAVTSGLADRVYKRPKSASKKANTEATNSAVTEADAIRSLMLRDIDLSNRDFRYEGRMYAPDPFNAVPAPRRRPRVPSGIIPHDDTRNILSEQELITIRTALKGL